jgi:hypothetical protein
MYTFYANLKINKDKEFKSVFDGKNYLLKKY